MASCLADASAIQRSASFRGYSGLGQLDVEAALLSLTGREVTAALTVTQQLDACLLAAAVEAVRDVHRDAHGPAPQLSRNGNRWTVTMQTQTGDVVIQATVALDVKTIKQGLLVLQVTATATHAPAAFSQRLLEVAALRA